MHTAKITASSDNIPTTFTSAAGSLVIDGAPSGGILYVMNLTTSVVVLTTAQYLEVPSATLSTNRNQLPIPPGSSTSLASGIIIDAFKIRQGDKVYVRSDSGSTITAGTLYVSVI